LLLIVYSLFPAGVFAQNSVLAEGQRFKIGITKTSVYKLDAAFFKNIGLNISTINPKNIQIYGYGGAMLPQKNNESRANDLIENAIFVKGEADGRFDDGDAVWFFGQSPHEIKYNDNGFLAHQLNLYADTTKLDYGSSISKLEKAAPPSIVLMIMFLENLN